MLYEVITHHQQIGLAHEGREILGEPVGGHGGTTGQQQLQGHGASHDIGGTDDDGIEAIGVDAGALDQGHDALGRTGAQCRDALRQTTYVIGMETVHVLVRHYAFDDQGGVDVLGERKLSYNFV